MSADMHGTSIVPGTEVLGVDGQLIGTVETVNPEGMRVAGHDIPRAAIAQVEEDRVILHLAKSAFRARRDPSLRP